MKVVADSHTIYWYLNNPAELSETALAALGDAEDSDGVSVSAITIPELWMASTRKRNERAIPRSGYEIVRSALTNDEFAFVIEPITPAVWRHFEVVSQHLPDPMDAIIVATAVCSKRPTVSKKSLDDLAVAALPLLPASLTSTGSSSRGSHDSKHIRPNRSGIA